MARHVIVDGSNIATEGRSKPSLKQLSEAVTAYMAENPKDLITVIVDATFGHRIDKKEVAEFDEAVNNNELVAPPAGTVGRGDAFVLSIAQKVKGCILSNDSYQEFHADYPWLFDDGRLIGGKPVPHVGWVFVTRTPVRGEKSRRATSAAKGDTKKKSPKPSAAALKPMPVPKAPPPGAVMPKKKESAPVAKKQVAESAGSGRTVNEILPFLQFVEHHPVGAVVVGKVESYSSHGAYVDLGSVRGYVPLRLMGEPPPRSAREVMGLGQEVTLEVVSVVASRRSIDLKPSTKKAPAKSAAQKKAPAKKTPAKKAPEKKPAVKKTDAKKTAAPKKVATPKKAVAKKAAVKKVTTPKKTAAKKNPPTKKSATKAAGAKK
ncbi:MAG: hypothetical protein B7C54_11030 [Acidimicrobiales bacterium mtb01]|nr:S1 RNA-binding domain-containing protein [Actinomycetota bacterium]TEX45589.1 MAG: hypothetical protein B7C54_11030 [Acidimicrobiales bacterium mtb01]